MYYLYIGLHEVDVLRISIKTAHERGKAVSLNFDRLSPPKNILGTRFCQRLSRPQNHRQEGLSQRKIPVTHIYIYSYVKRKILVIVTTDLTGRANRI